MVCLGGAVPIPVSDRAPLISNQPIPKQKATGVPDIFFRKPKSHKENAEDHLQTSRAGKAVRNPAQLSDIQSPAFFESGGLASITARAGSKQTPSMPMVRQPYDTN